MTSSPTISYVSHRETLYSEAAGLYGAALSRLACAYEADPDKRRDLLQDIHLQLWRSFQGSDSRCSLRTWVERVAHHTATSHVVPERRTYARLVSMEAIDNAPVESFVEGDVDRRNTLEKLSAMILQLKPLDRQIMLLYLGGLEAGAIAESTGLSPGNVAMKVHRIKTMLARRFQAQGGEHA